MARQEVRISLISAFAGVTRGLVSKERAPSKRLHRHAEGIGTDVWLLLVNLDGAPPPVVGARSKL
jgi:hypothetical protein